MNVSTPGADAVRRPMTAATVLAVLLVSCLASGARGQSQSPRPGRQAAVSLNGRDTFEAYCAPCHGRRGAGNGPVASSLTKRPSDLRRLKSLRGVFPREELVSFIDGSRRAITAHGTVGMPIWGEIFMQLDPPDARVRRRLENVVDYLESLQQ